jgi:hypothetical protein
LSGSPIGPFRPSWGHGGATTIKTVKPHHDKKSATPGAKEARSDTWSWWTPEFWNPSDPEDPYRRYAQRRFLEAIEEDDDARARVLGGLAGLLGQHREVLEALDPADPLGDLDGATEVDLTLVGKAGALAADLVKWADTCNLFAGSRWIEERAVKTLAAWAGMKPMDARIGLKWCFADLRPIDYPRLRDGVVVREPDVPAGPESLVIHLAEVSFPVFDPAASTKSTPTTGRPAFGDRPLVQEDHRSWRSGEGPHGGEARGRPLVFDPTAENRDDFMAKVSLCVEARLAEVAGRLERLGFEQPFQVREGWMRLLVRRTVLRVPTSAMVGTVTKVQTSQSFEVFDRLAKLVNIQLPDTRKRSTRARPRRRSG